MWLRRGCWPNAKRDRNDTFKGLGCRCEGHSGLAPSPTSPGLQPAAGFAAGIPRRSSAANLDTAASPAYPFSLRRPQDDGCREPAKNADEHAIREPIQARQRASAADDLDADQR
jgi:hypothetical protein